MARSASPPTRSTGMITDTFGVGIEDEELRIEDVLDNAILNPQFSILNSHARQANL